jgi:hypothetical protein
MATTWRKMKIDRRIPWIDEDGNLFWKDETPRRKRTNVQMLILGDWNLAMELYEKLLLRKFKWLPKKPTKLPGWEPVEPVSEYDDDSNLDESCGMAIEADETVYVDSSGNVWRRRTR